MADAKANPQYCAGTLGDGTSDQLQYYLHYGYDPENVRDTGAGCHGILGGVGDIDVFVCEAFYEEIRTGRGKCRSSFRACQKIISAISTPHFMAYFAESLFQTCSKSS